MGSLSSSILVVLPLVLAVLYQPSTAAGPGPRRGPMTGGWSPIENPNVPKVIDIANFALSEHNKEAANAKLGLGRVIEGETQIVAGTNYNLVIEAKDGDTVKNYEVIVWVKEWEHFSKLTSFKPL